VWRVRGAGDNRHTFGILVGNMNEKSHLEDTGTDVRIIRKFLLKK
jgi:hypothetical protein